MTNFSDQLFTDLMRDHAATLQRTGLTATARHPALKRGAWLAGGAGTLAVGVTASLAAFGGGAAQAFAVTPNPDGTVTVSVSDLSGVSGANAKLRDLGDRVVLVPVRSGCPSISSLPSPAGAAGRTSGSVTGSKENGTITVEAQGIPAGDLMVLAIQRTGHIVHIAGRLTTSPAPGCVSIPQGQPAYHSTDGRVGGKDSGGAPGITQRTGSGNSRDLSTSAG